MDLLQLSYFKKVTECQSMTAAARDLMITTSSLCASIRRLEQDLGYRLFDRVGRNNQLNENGKLVLEHTCSILNSVEMMHRELERRNSGKEELYIGTTNRTYWVKAINRFAVQHPSASISVSFLNCSDLLNPYLYVHYDVIFSGASDFNQPDWEKETLIENDTPMLLAYAEHPATEKASVDLREVAAEPFIAFDKKDPSRLFFDDLFAKADLVPNVVINCDQFLRAPLIASGYGLGVTTRYGSKTDLLSNLVAIPISYPPYIREQAMFHYKKKTSSTIESEFREFMLDYMKISLNAASLP